MTTPSSTAEAVLAALTQLGQGTTAEIREKTGRARSTIDKAIRELADAGLIGDAEPDPASGSARWQPIPAITGASDPLSETRDRDDGQASNTSHPDAPTEAAGDQDAAADAGQPIGDSTTVGAAHEPVEPRPEAPPRPADRKVLIVAGILGDYPDGTTAEVIAHASGLGPATVARLLTAMEQADAARRIPADPQTGTAERWIPGDGKASAVDPNPAPERCPTCGQVVRVGRPRATGGREAAVRNADGSEPLARNVLRGWVHEFLTAHPGQVFSPQDIANELSARHNRVISNGAVRNNCTTLAAAGLIQLATETPLAFTANPADQTITER